MNKYLDGSPADWVMGRHVRLTLKELDPKQVNAILDSCVPHWLRMGGRRDNEKYAPTLHGLLQSSRGESASLLIGRIVDYLTESLHRDTSFHACSDSERQLT